MFENDYEYSKRPSPPIDVTKNPNSKEKYIIVSNNDLYDFQQEVNYKITHGYIPHGNFIVEPTHRGHYFQAMILKE